MKSGADIPFADSSVGRLIADKFFVVDRLGAGGTASVYGARHEQLGKKIALKVLQAERVPATYVRRFQREAQAACRLDHPNCVRILDFGRDGDLLYLAMEYIEGETLEALIKREAPMRLARIVELMSQVLAGLGAAHDLGIVHRDVKPANVMITQRLNDEDRPYDCAKVCDFGMAKVFGAPGEDGQNITDFGAILGTPHYMSPEQASGETVDERTDVYGCGVVLYEMAAGRLPFEAATITGLLMKHLREQPSPPSRWVKGLNPDLERLIMWTLEKEVGRRCPTVKTLRRELVKLIDLSGFEETELSLDGFGRMLMEQPDELADTAPREVVSRPAARKPPPDAVTEPMGAVHKTIDLEETEDLRVLSEPVLLLPEHKKKK